MHIIGEALKAKFVPIALICLVSAVIFVFGRHLSIDGVAPLGSLGGQLVASTLVPIVYVVLSMIQGRFEGFFLERASNLLHGFGAKEKEHNSEGSSTSHSEQTLANATAKAELKTMSARFRQTRTTLKGLRRDGILGRRWLYQLPWYAVIGASGSGKTTVIANSGLDFLLAQRLSARNCDWWLTDHAVLIDTPGYSIIDEPHPDQAKAVWHGFLQLLSRSYRRQPLKGVLISIAIDELSSSSQEELLNHAGKIRQRILELYRKLGVRIPIYVLLNKSDLIAGFKEFFGNLGDEGREAVWGFTFAQVPLDSERASMDGYAAEYDALVGRLNDRLLERMHQETDIQRRALVFSFPQQIASLKHPSQKFLNEVFATNSFEEPIMLRGIYFVSGTQSGPSFDRVIAATARTFSITQPARPTSLDQKRSFFITRLLRELVIPEVGLIEVHPGVERRQRWRRYGFRAMIGGLVCIACVFSMVRFARNLHMVETVHQTLSRYSQEVKKLRVEPVDNSDLRPVLPLLKRLRDMETGYDKDAKSSDYLNFDRSKELGVQTRAAYTRGLELILLPRLILRLEKLLADRQDDPLFLYQALKVYLMLGGQGPFEPKVVKDWMTLDWEVEFRAEADASLRRELAEHLDILIENPRLSIGLDRPLIEKSRAKLNTISLPRRVLNILTTTPQAVQLPAWRLSDHAGPMAEDVLIRKSGQPLNTGVAGIYTRAGFNGLVLPMLPRIADAVAAEDWVLRDKAIPPGVEASQMLQRAAVDLYFQDFALNWDELINDISIRPVVSVDDMLRTLNALSAPTSPMRLFLTAAARETNLDEPLAPETQTNDIAKGKPWESNLQALFHPAGVPNISESQRKLYTDQHFQWLQQLVNVVPNSPPGSQAPIESAIRDLGSLYQSLGNVGDSALEKGDPTAVAIRKIEVGAANLPRPIQQWVRGVGQLSSKLSTREIKVRLAEMWAVGAGDVCRRATAGRYPFVRGSRRDIPLGDFARLFRRDGIIATFFSERLSSFVVQSENSWTFSSKENSKTQIERDTLAQFKRAAAIGDSMFKGGGDQPSFEFLLTVADTGPSTNEVGVEIDGQRLTQRRGEYKPVRFHWPSAGGVGGASITFNASESAALSEAGPWALLRLLDKGQTLSQEDPARIYVRLVAGHQWATFILQSDNLINPLSRNLLSEFRCPRL
ncbi:type VI secretion system membrane subunit TssM [Rhizobium sp. NLR9b]|uniref:type VI secretion system membrane subunit TssM n=1 Tax=unclassified Rhizobium TaxID=2613769 RepID=UPI001C82C8C7|nr:MULTISPECIES: type VI secretion system membrane subunit TssM [unclassified Rhizobium]MBX5230634.1 type VI secretion system membrane subunit TssM [Rhizobium sp. NLR9b]MBX5291302.1 type VI secretion system membrane subunit TssM [Rhizobium sp. NLR10b]